MSVIPMRVTVEPRAMAKRKAGRVYAIAFDLDVRKAGQISGGDGTNCYKQIEAVFNSYAFHRKQGSVYFGGEDSTPVDCIMAVQDVDRKHAWFAHSVKDLRMLRVEENNDLLPAINRRLRLEGDEQAA